MRLSDYMWIAISLIVAVAVMIFNRRRYGDHLTPIGIVFGVNLASLCCYHLKMLNFHEVHPQTHLIIFIGLAAFLSAVLFKLPRHLDRMRVGPVELATLTPIFYGVVVLSICGWATSLFLMIGRHGLAYMLANAWVLEKEFQMQYVGYLNLFGILVLPMYVIRKVTRSARRLDLALAVLSLVGLLLAGIKQYVIFTSASAVVAYAVLKPGKVSIRHALFGLVVILSFFVIYDTYIDLFVSHSFPESRFPHWMAFVERPYLYFTGSWPAMDRLVMDRVIEEPVFGYITLQPIWKILGDGLHLMEPVGRFLPEVEIGPQGYNVFSFFGEIYWDFGIIGVAVISFLVGWFASSLYLKSVTGGAWGFVLMYAIFAYGLVVSFFAYYYRFEMFILLSVVFVLAFVVAPRLPEGRIHAE